MRNNIKYLVIHHTLVSRQENKRQFDAVRNYHKSKGWGEIGYHYFLEPDGALLWGRRENEPGAHVIEDRINYKSLGICLTGNFDEEMPTREQLNTLKILLLFLRNKYNIVRKNVKFHRDFASYKSCPGRLFTKDILKTIMPMKELYRDKQGGFWFIKNRKEGKQKVDSIGGILTILSREFGVDTVDDDFLNKFKDEKYFN